jgi:glycosyltransferase involved in cell wall biosynthesis
MAAAARDYQVGTVARGTPYAFAPVTQACAYLVSRYPGLTHTFIVNEVRALRETGVRVETATVRRVPVEQLLSDVDREENRATHALLPASPPRLLAAHARALAAGPRAYAATAARALRSAHAGGRPRLWQAFYFGEAILLWDWMRSRGLRHVHVHHANVSADVALLTCAFANGAGARPRWTWSMTIHGPTELLDMTTHKLGLKAADAAAVVCTSDFARSQVASQLPAGRREHLHTVYCGIDSARFRPPADPAPRREVPSVLCVAALSPRKGHDVLLDAIRRLRDAAVPVRLTIVGDGSERAALEARARELGIETDVEFAGAVGNDRVPEYYAATDVFCLPSFAEGVPTVLQEAMATGLPVVATDVNGTAELVDHERSGLLVSPARSDLLAAALGRLLADPELRRQYGAAGRARIERDFDRLGAATRLRGVLDPFLAVSARS